MSIMDMWEVILPTKKVSKKIVKTNRDSLLEYLKVELSKLEERKNLDLGRVEIKNGNKKGTSMKEVRCWKVDNDGNVIFNMRIKNKKIYRNEDCQGVMKFKSRDYNGVKGELELFAKGLETSEEFSVYTKSIKDKITSIHTLIV